MPSLPPVRKVLSSLAAAFALLPILLLPQPAVAAGTLQQIVAKLGGHPCRVGALTCVDIEVPYDHASNDPKGHLTVEFAVHFADRKSKGVLFYAVGGPGGSGIESADDYLSGYAQRLSDRMDIVFFDQRGVGPLSGIDCPKALARYDMTTLEPDHPDEAIVAAKTVVSDCTAEMQHKDLLPYLDTEQAIGDLEAFRQAIGAPKVWLYGESYGTQFAQQYAAAFPGAIDGLILDGVVDLTLDAEGFYAEDARTAERLLARVLAACGETPGCREDTAEAPEAVFDGLAAKLDKAPVTVTYPLPTGELASRRMTRGMLDAVAFYALYTPEDRAQLLRALAAASHDNLVPLMRLGYSNLGIDPVTLEGQSDPTFYGAAYYAITCTDYAEPGTGPDAIARRLLEQAKAMQAQLPRFGRDYYAERLACAYWPAKGSLERPKPFAGGDYPTLILNADTDPATPISNGYAVFDRVKHGYMVTMKGGPHVIWGRGLACPDKIVLDLMLDGKAPEAHEQLCQTPFIGDYTRLTLADPNAQSDPFAVARAIETELGQLPELYMWDGKKPVTVGCDAGGTIEARSTDSGTDYRFKDCALWPGLRVSGAGSDKSGGDEADGLTLDLEIGGSHQGHIDYRHNTVTEAMSLGGDYDGRAVATPRPRIR